MVARLLRPGLVLPFAAAASVSLHNSSHFDMSQLSTSFDDGETLARLHPPCQQPAARPCPPPPAAPDGRHAPALVAQEPPDWIKKMTEHFDFSPSSRKAAEKAWANAAHLDGEGGDELPPSDMEDGGMFSGMGDGVSLGRSRPPLPRPASLPPLPFATRTPDGFAALASPSPTGGMPAGMAEAMEKMGGIKGAGPGGMSAGGATLMPGGPGMPGGSRPLPGGSSAAPSAFNPKRAGAGGSGPAVGGQRAASSAAAPPEERDPDFTGEMPAEGGGPGLASRALEQARAALRDAERASQEAERAKKAAILAGRQLGADLTKELPDARTGPTRETSVEPADAEPSRGAAAGHKSAGGNGPAIGKQRSGGSFGRGGGGGGGGGSDGEGADELPENMLEDDVVVAPRRASSASRVENFDDGEGGRPEE